jgi:copper resistance protein D
MTDVLSVAAIVARFAHLGSACLVTGVFAFLVIIARPAVRAAGADAGAGFALLDRRLLALGAAALGVALGTGLIDLTRQTLVAAGNVGGNLAAPTIGTLLLDTRYGDVWLVRHALWLLLVALLVLREPERDASDWHALRVAGLVLAGAGLAVGAASGHAASAPDASARAIPADALHLLATGIWAGALVPFALFLHWARPGRPGAPPTMAAVVAVRRFSTLGILSVAVVLASGAYALLQQVGGVPALLGTTYGRWLSVKLGLLFPLLGIAFFNLAYLRPRLRGAASDPGVAGVLVARLGRCVVFEALLVAAILGAVAVLGLTAPARHEAIAWPLPFRFTWEIADLPGPWTRVTVGGPLALGGLMAALAAVTLRRHWRRRTLMGGAAALCLGLALALPPLGVDAYPTTYVRPAVPYAAASIARGQAVYREHCLSCHGHDASGDGSAGTRGASPSVDLTGRRIAEHTAGDLYWWITHGVRGSAGHAFGDRLSSEQRWDLVNLLRTFSAARTAQGLGTEPTPTPAIVAPDFSYNVGVGANRALRDYRGQTIVLLVFFRLPESRERLSQLGDAYFDFRRMGAEILAVPLEGATTVYQMLGRRPILFPFAIGGARDAVATYELFRGDASPPAHMEMLVDRQGYLRARWVPALSADSTGGWSDVKVLLGDLERLDREPASAPDPGDHIH